MIQPFVQELDLNHNEPLILCLDAVIKRINYDRSTVDKRQLNIKCTKEHALRQCSQEMLKELEEYHCDREHAALDCNILKFDNYQFDSIQNVLATYISSYLQGITAMGISGRTWYPPEFGYMGWHTNSNHKCHRLYCSFCREGNKSFFRYRDTSNQEIVTSWDKEGWNFRLFTITKPYLWHCVYSETDRFSIGYAIHTTSFSDN